MSVHYVRPSNLGRSLECPGWINESKDLPTTESDESQEGTEYHTDTAVSIFEKSEPDPENELVHRAWKFFREKAAGAIRVEVEKPAAYPPLIRGTADLVAYFPDRVVIIDWKFGYKPISQDAAIAQLAAYFLGVCGHLKHPAKAEVWIYMPRLDIRYSHEFHIDEIPEIAQRIAEINARCESPDAPLSPAAWACEYCPAAIHGTCRAIHAEAREIVKLDTQHPMTLDQVKRVLELQPALERIIKAARETCREILERGGQMDGWYLQTTRGRRAIDSGKIHNLHTASRKYVSAEALLDCGSFSFAKVHKLLTDAIANETKAKKKDASVIADEILAPFVVEGAQSTKLMRGQS